MKRSITGVLVLALALGLAGCATQYYPEYADGQKTAATAAAQTNQQVLTTLGTALHSPNAGTQTAAAMGLAFWLAKHKPIELEQARPGPIEQGIGKALPSLPMWGALFGMFSNSGGTTNVNQEVSGGGTGGINLGSGTAATTTATTVIPAE